MEQIGLPKIVEEKIGKSRSRFVIEPLYPGYGATIGNALRRVLLSSITGAAATSFKIDGVTHEFTAIPHAKEDVVEMMMNLKDINFKSFSDEPVTLQLSKKGPALVTAADFKANSKIEIENPEAPIITLDNKAAFELEVTIEKDRGFRPVNTGAIEKTEIGQINIDALFSPVKRVSLDIEDTRVGQMTNYNKLILDVTTNGVIEPMEALKEASSVLVDHYRAIMSDEPVIVEEVEADNIPEIESLDDAISVSDVSIDNKTKTEEIGLSPRTTNALINAGIKTYGGLKRLSALKLEEVKGMGKKGIDEIQAILEK